MKSHLLSASVALLFTITLPAAETPKVIDVKTIGAGKPVILIPGLASPGAVWDDVVKDLSGKYQCHVVTVAGFGGLPPVKSEHLLDDVRDQIIAYAQENKLTKPALIGHSLGGTLALAIAEKAPELPGDIIIVDSLPFLDAVMLPGVTDAQGARQAAAGMRAMIEKNTPEQFAAYQRNVSIPSMVTKPEDGQRIAEMCGKSDPATVGQAMAELMTSDERADLSKIKCPILVLGSLADKAQYPREEVEKNYKSQYATHRKRSSKCSRSRNILL